MIWSKIKKFLGIQKIEQDIYSIEDSTDEIRSRMIVVSHDMDKLLKTVDALRDEHINIVKTIERIPKEIVVRNVLDLK